MVLYGIVLYCIVLYIYLIKRFSVLYGDLFLRVTKYNLTSKNKYPYKTENRLIRYLLNGFNEENPKQLEKVTRAV